MSYVPCTFDAHLYVFRYFAHFVAGLLRFYTFSKSCFFNENSIFFCLCNYFILLDNVQTPQVKNTGNIYEKIKIAHIGVFQR